MNKITDQQKDGLRELAFKVKELSMTAVNAERLALWQAHNSLENVRPLVYVMLNCWKEIFKDTKFLFHDGIFNTIELDLRQRLYYASLGFDYVVNPFITIPAVFENTDRFFIWGLNTEPRQVDSGSRTYSPPIRQYEDIEKLSKPKYSLNFKASDEILCYVESILGDILEVKLDCGGVLGISAQLGHHAAELRGLEQLMTDVVDNPDWVRRLMQFLMDGHLEWLDAYESSTRVLPNHIRWPFYSKPLQQDYNPATTRIKDCWGYGESQEFDLFSPQMFSDFLLDFQIPIFEKTSLNNYGCCENLTKKYPLLERIPNLRRVSVSPWTDFGTAVDWAEDRNVLNWRYAPAEVVFHFSEDRIRQNIRHHLIRAKDSHIEIVLQDIETTGGHHENIKEWCRIAMEEATAS